LSHTYTMNKIINFFIFKTAFSTNVFPIIRNLKYPVCVNCIHFIEHKNNYPYDPPPDSREYGKCKLFGEINMITGVIDYDFAKFCRYDSKKCGNNGVKFEEKPK